MIIVYVYIIIDKHVTGEIIDVPFEQLFYSNNKEVNTLIVNLLWSIPTTS